jgi:hypothetical protein
MAGSRLARHYALAFRMYTTIVNLAWPALAVTRQQPSVGKTMLLAQKWGARARPGLI